MPFPPAALLALFFVLIVSHTFYLWHPARMPYWRRLLLSAIALALGEVLAALGLLPQVRVGELHVATDLGLAAALQLLGQRRPQPAPRRPRPSR